MNKFTKIFLCLFACSALAFGQASMTTTTLSSALSAGSSSTVVNVASATNISGPALPFPQGGIGSPSGSALTLLFVDREVMRVNSVSGTAVSVSRGWDGTSSMAHASGAKVWVGPGSAFTKSEPVGVCILSQLTVNPRVNSLTGNIYTCGNGKWTTFATFVGQQTLGAAIDSTGAGVTVAPTNPVHHVVNTGSIATITVPPACPAVCTIVLIPDAAFTTTTAGNIALASTGVVSKALTMTWDGNAVKWFPSY